MATIQPISTGDPQIASKINSNFNTLNIEKKASTLLVLNMAGSSVTFTLTRRDNLVTMTAVQVLTNYWNDWDGQLNNNIPSGYIPSGPAAGVGMIGVNAGASTAAFRVPFQLWVESGGKVFAQVCGNNVVGTTRLSFSTSWVTEDLFPTQ